VNETTDSDSSLTFFFDHLDKPPVSETLGSYLFSTFLEHLHLPKMSYGGYGGGYQGGYAGPNWGYQNQFATPPAGRKRYRGASLSSCVYDFKANGAF
jgi:hypothetical protein